MGIFIVSKFLFLLSYIYCNLDGLLDIAYCPIEFEGPLRLFWLIINLTKKVVYKLMCKSFDLDFGNHFNHIRYHFFSLGNV